MAIAHMQSKSSDASGHRNASHKALACSALQVSCSKPGESRNAGVVLGLPFMQQSIAMCCSKCCLCSLALDSVDCFGSLFWQHMQK